MNCARAALSNSFHLTHPETEVIMIAELTSGSVIG